METKNEYKMTEIGEIPVEWEVSSLKKLGTFFKGKGIAKKDLSIKGNKCILYGQLYTTYKERINEVESYTEIDIKNPVIGKENDLLLPSSGETPIDIATASSLHVNEVYIGGDINVFRSWSQIDSDFLSYQINSIRKFELSRLAQGSSISHLYKEHLENFKVIVPPLDEQKKIAEILSTVDEQIDQTDQLIKKTKELKKGLLQQLLTKGINHTEFKNSELGEIPVEWDIALFEDIMLSKGEGIRRGPFGGALKKEIFVEEGFAIYEQQHAIHKDTNKFRYFITPEKYDEMAAFNVKSGDILMSCSGTIGRVLLVPEDAPEGIINQALLRLRPKSYINLQFLKYLLQSEFVQNNILDRAHGSALKNMVAVSELKKIKLRIPQEEEQKKIAEILYSVDEEIEGYQEEKAKYEELKKGLMQQLLTGKRRVKV